MVLPWLAITAVVCWAFSVSMWLTAVHDIIETIS